MNRLVYRSVGCTWRRSTIAAAFGALEADLGPAHLSDLKLIVWQSLKSALPRVAEDADVAVLIDRRNERIEREADSAGVPIALGDNFLAVVDAFESLDRTVCA